MLFISAGLLAQEKAEVKVKIMKDGKMIKDTTYMFDDAKKAEHAVHMMEMVNNGDMHMKMMSDECTQKKMVFISEDGDVKEIKDDGEVQWITSKVSEDGETTEIHKVIKSAGADCGEKVIIEDEDGEVEVIIKKMNDGKEGMKVEKKKIIILDDEDGESMSWTVKENENGKLVAVSEDGEEINMKKVSEEADGKVVKWVSADNDDDVKVIVVKKEIDEDHHNMDVEVTVDKQNKEKVKKKNKE